MTPAKLKEKVIVERSARIRKMSAAIRGLPLDSREIFLSDPRNAAAAESYLRRGLEALMDLGRHIMAKTFGQAVPQYKAISKALLKDGVLETAEAELMEELAGYRNRMVHFYHEVGHEELYRLCKERLDDLDGILAAILKWVKEHPELLDKSL